MLLKCFLLLLTKCSCNTCFSYLLNQLRYFLHVASCIDSATPLNHLPENICESSILLLFPATPCLVKIISVSRLSLLFCHQCSIYSTHPLMFQILDVPTVPTFDQHLVSSIDTSGVSVHYVQFLYT